MDIIALCNMVESQFVHVSLEEYLESPAVLMDYIRAYIIERQKKPE
jgi:hypothetical protein